MNKNLSLPIKPDMTEHRKKIITHYYQNKIPHTELLIDNVWDPHNVSAVARTADGLGISKINLYYTYNNFPNLNKVGKKTSSSANKWMQFEKIIDLDTFAQQKRQENYQFIGTDMCEGASTLTHYQFPEKCIIIMGAESGGMSEEIKSLCDQFIFIPMVGMVSSYNISVAAAMVLYELFKQKGNNLQLKTPEDFQNNHNRRQVKQ